MNRARGDVSKGSGERIWCDMISCTEFIPAYSELFKFLHSLGAADEGQPNDAVLEFWASLSDSFLNKTAIRRPFNIRSRA